jgi:hypothetical protein
MKSPTTTGFQIYTQSKTKDHNNSKSQVIHYSTLSELNFLRLSMVTKVQKTSPIF